MIFFFHFSPWEVTYNASTGFGERSMHQECSAWNRNGCAYRSCMVEGFFITSLFELLGHGARVVSEYNHQNGFNHDERCTKVTGIGGPATPGQPACCGEYPNVFPYREYDNGSRKCCVKTTDGKGVLFNPNVMQCCEADGVPRFSCI